jgi:hypothetical protein
MTNFSLDSQTPQTKKHHIDRAQSDDPLVFSDPPLLPRSIVLIFIKWWDMSQKVEGEVIMQPCLKKCYDLENHYAVCGARLRKQGNTVDCAGSDNPRFFQIHPCCRHQHY